MAYTDDLLNAAQRRRTRTGNSYFPAANTYRGININAGPSANAINSTPQGQTIIPSRYGTSPAVLPPDQNTAYQAAISKPRMSRSDMTWIKTPNGGYINAPTASVDRISSALTGSNTVAATPPPPAINYGSQVGFSMLSNVPSAPSVPPVAARPYEAPAAPYSTSESIGRGLSYANPLRAIAPIGSALSYLGGGAVGIARDLYGGFTGNRASQPPPSEMGAGATPVQNPLTPNPWGNAFWNRGLPGRYFDPNYNQ